MGVLFYVKTSLGAAGTQPVGQTRACTVTLAPIAGRSITQNCNARSAQRKPAGTAPGSQTTHYAGVPPKVT